MSNSIDRFLWDSRFFHGYRSDGAKKYDPNQPRDRLGRWSAGGYDPGRLAVEGNLTLSKLFARFSQSPGSHNRAVMSWADAVGENSAPVIYGLMVNWIGSSSSGTAAGIQLAAAELFNSPTEQCGNWLISQSDWDVMSGEDKRLLGRIARAQYDLTQKFLRSNNIKFVRLFRGVTLDRNSTETPELDSEPEYEDTPLASWSTNRSVAVMFMQPNDEGESEWEGHAAKALLVADIPSDEIFSLPMTGLGSYKEQEVVVLSRGLRKARVANALPTIPRSADYDPDKI